MLTCRDEQVYHVTRIIKERSGTCCSPNSQTLNGQDQVVTVVEPLVHERTLFFFSSSPAPSLASLRLRVHATPQHTATQHNTAEHRTNTEAKRREE